MAKSRASRGVIKPDQTQTETVLSHLERAVEELNEAAWFFDGLEIPSLSESLDEAILKIENVHEIIDVLLGRVELADAFESPSAKAEPAKKLPAMAKPKPPKRAAKAA